MTEQITPTLEPTLEDVKAPFETWRNTRKSRQTIPDHLWHSAVRLSKKHRLSEIC